MIAFWLRDRRKELGLTQAALARLLGTTQTQISWWETGRVRPASKHLRGLTEILGQIDGAALPAPGTDALELPHGSSTRTDPRETAGPVPPRQHIQAEERGFKGRVLVSKRFGYCKIIDERPGQVHVHFIGANRDAWYTVRAIKAPDDFEWSPIPVGMKCEVPGRGVCTVSEVALRPTTSEGIHEYIVTFEGDAAETARLNERVLWPIPGSLAETPLSKLASLETDPFASFRVREGFLRALLQIENESAGIRALAAGRVALLPHQAFVIGTVVDDPVWRYILADEVGLGKTIEAGAIAHQLLTEKPDARILVLCPGPLTRQWLCEMHQSFGGRHFRLLDLYGPGNTDTAKWPLIISSLKVADRNYAEQLTAKNWDLVIVDEAHRLLWNADHYKLVERVAGQTPRLLLLSAVPARERETELLRLLRLIEPERYTDGSIAAARFSELYAAQASIGRRLRIIARQLESPADLDRDQLNSDLRRLLDIPILQADAELQGHAHAAIETVDASEALQRYRRLLDEVVARYRISRRILKNRRGRLVDATLLGAVERSAQLLSYDPSPLETQIGAVALDLLRSIPSDTNDDALQVLFRKTIQAFCDPVALFEIAIALLAADDEARSAPLTFDTNAALDYDEHESLLSACGAMFSSRMDDGGLRRWTALLRAATEMPQSERLRTLRTYVRGAFERGAAKLLVFVGTHATAESVTEYLVDAFGDDAVATFRHDQADDEKEDEVLRFRRDPRCALLVSDESGGEGRNFQFVDELIHFDLPWSVAAVEQRIGRLDRIGRNRGVPSTVICPRGGIEEAWFRCLLDGFGVFARSISGLEFMLQTAERLAVTTALSSGPEGLADIVSAIRDASERERASDDAEAITDTASFRPSSRYLRQSTCDGDAGLEKALPPYLRSISRDGAAKQVTDRKDVGLRIWRLSPDAVTDYELAGLQREGDTPLNDRYGTFSREVARDRPDLEFYAVGHPLVDALAMAARRHIRGRTFVAKMCTSVASPPVVMVSAWRVGYLEEDGPHAVPELALRLLQRRVVWVIVDLTTNEALDPAIATRLVAALTKEDRVAEVDQDMAVGYIDAAGEWSKTASALVEQAARHAQEAYKSKFGEKDAHLCEQLTRDAREMSRKRPDEGRHYARTRLATVAAVERATLYLDVLGLLKLERSEA